MHRSHDPRPDRRFFRRVAAACGVPLFALAGCISPPPTAGEPIGLTDADQSAADRAFATEPFSDQIKAGVLRQRTLYEHHFENGSQALNSLGRRDVAILADAMRASGGRISVQRGSADKDLYAARLKSVRAAVASFGIPAKRLKLDAGPPGGTGVASIEAIKIHGDIREGRLDIGTGTTGTDEGDEGGEE